MSSSYQDLPDSRSQEIAYLATTVADDYFANHQVDPKAILDDFGISCIFGNYGDTFDGLLEHENGQFRVYCNMSRCGHPNRPRARFTLAHELGHYYIDEHRRALQTQDVKRHQSYCSFESNRLIEREADLFATCLLMPPYRFAEKIENFDKGLGGVLDLKEHFGTSITSTAIRYVKHDPMPCAVIKWQPDGYGWRWVSQSMFERGLGQTMDNIEDLPRKSATEKAITDKSPLEGRYHENGGTASHWFPNRPQGTGDPILWEQAVSLGQFGALTFLYPDSSSQSSSMRVT